MATAEITNTVFTPATTAQEVDLWIKNTETTTKEKVTNVWFKANLSGMAKGPGNILTPIPFTANCALESPKGAWDDLQAVCVKHGFKEVQELFKKEVIADINKLCQEHDLKEIQNILSKSSELLFKKDLLRLFEDFASDDIEEYRLKQQRSSMAFIKIHLTGCAYTKAKSEPIAQKEWCWNVSAK